MSVTLSQLLKTLIDQEGTDLHISTNIPPILRIHGSLVPMKMPPLTPNETKQLCYSVLTDAQKHRFEEDLEIDFSFSLRGLARFRANVYNQRGAVAGAFRTIPHQIPPMEKLGLPSIVAKVCEKPRGLVLVTGPTGSGKSTTLAAMVDKINNDRRCHILTIEDPIEYMHHHKKCLVNQREINSDTHSFNSALRAALRQDPDVVLIGEMRDLETMETAITIAETGHLTFATLHTNSAPETINRLVDAFPAHQQAQVRAQLSLALEAIFCQSLLPNLQRNGRTLVMEVLIPNSAVRNLIREDKIHQIYSAMQTGQGRHGMQTFNQALATAYFNKKISYDTAMSATSHREELTDMIKRGTGLIESANYQNSAGAAPNKRQ
jgi:twitching motility protein PilT